MSVDTGDKSEPISCFWVNLSFPQKTKETQILMFSQWEWFPLLYLTLWKEPLGQLLRAQITLLHDGHHREYVEELRVLGRRDIKTQISNSYMSQSHLLCVLYYLQEYGVFLIVVGE